MVLWHKPTSCPPTTKVIGPEPWVYGMNIQVEYQGKILLRKYGEALAQAAQGGGGVTAYGGIRETWRCGTEGQGLVGSTGAK